MENKKFNFEIITPIKKVFSNHVDSVVAPGIDGYFGVLDRHAPLVSALGVGEIRVKTGEQELFFATSGGFLEVLSHHVTVLAETAEESSEIDVQRAEAAKTRAHQRLSEGRKTWDIERAQASLSRALNRMRVAARTSG